MIKASLGAVAAPGGWDGNRAKLPVTFDGNRLRPGHYEGEIELEGSAGNARIPFTAKVAGPSFWPPFLTVVACAARRAQFRARWRAACRLFRRMWFPVGSRCH